MIGRPVSFSFDGWSPTASVSLSHREFDLLRHFVRHPGRVFRILWNFLRGRETSKMESFLHETSRKFRLRLTRRKSADV